MNIKVNNVNIYYETYGEGEPIILLHGNRETHQIFDKLIEQLKGKYKVYAIDSRCHGKSEDTNEISYELMRDDIIEFINKLEIKEPTLYGFSDGGIVGLMVAMKERYLLSKLIVSGVNLNPKRIKTIYANIIKDILLFYKKQINKNDDTRTKYATRRLRKCKNSNCYISR